MQSKKPVSNLKTNFWNSRSISLVFVTSLVLFQTQNARGDGSVPIIGDVKIRLDPKNQNDLQVLKNILNKDAEYKQTSKETEKGYPVEIVKQGKIGDSNLAEITATIKDVRNAICKALGTNDEFKLTMAWDASAKVWGIGVAGNTGIEVTVKCKK